MRGVIYGSVCSGIEAASVAWHSLGWKPAFFSEIEPFPCAVLAHRFPAVPNLGDMTKFEDWPDATLDVLAGGTPCQSFSVAGLRKGLADPRGNLMLTFGAIARRYRPCWLVWENVPGVLSSNGGRDFGTFLGMLGELGYGFAYRVLDAQFFGVAQRRRRVFVVGCLGDWRAAAAVLFERHSLSGDTAPSREARKVAPTIPSRSTGGGGLGTDFDCDGGLIPEIVGQAMSAKWSKGTAGPAGDEHHNLIPVPQVAHALRGEGFDASEDGTGRGTPIIAVHGTQDPDAMTELAHPLGRNSGQENVIAFDTTQITSPANYSKPKPGDPCHPLAAGAHAPAVAVALQDVRGINKAQNGRGWNDEGTAYTVDTHATQGVATAMQVRRLTPRECERLQGFPDDWTLIPYRNKPADDCPDGPRYKALGNSMAVPVMHWIGVRIAQVAGVCT